jgi:sulfatase maturation enzyme AslB (radical SAM superfamily)
VYFAGGEPLIMKEHYYLLDQLLALGKTDVRIQYNTNFSELRYKDKHVFDYWKHFQNVSVGASLDGMGPHAELIRKGADWQQTVHNRKRMMADVPHVDFYVSATVSAMNVLHVLEFHKTWTELGLIKAQDFNVNICQSPDWYRIDIFPEWSKTQVIKPAYERHLAWLEPQDQLRRATNGFTSILNLMMAQDNSAMWPRFAEEIDKLDQLRGENFWQLTPEYDTLRSS